MCMTAACWLGRVSTFLYGTGSHIGPIRLEVSGVTRGILKSLRWSEITSPVPAQHPAEGRTEQRCSLLSNLAVSSLWVVMACVSHSSFTYCNDEYQRFKHSLFSFGAWFKM